jgi:DNA repair protein RecN (Recombination protein N)
MLQELRIGGLVLADEVVISLGTGLTVITGETGAGKSLIAGAFSLLCGGRADKDLVREGETTAYVEGVFDLAEAPAQRSFLARCGIRVGSDAVLVLRRELRRQGRSRVLINGLLSSLPLLARVGPRLLAIQSQDQQHQLADPAYARDLLDAALGLQELRVAARRAWEAYRQAEDGLAAFREESRLAREQLDLWRHQHEELTAADLRPGEEQELVERLQVARHASALREAAAATQALLEEGPAPLREQLARSLGLLQAGASRSRELSGVRDSLAAAQEAVADAARALSGFLDRIEFDGRQLAELEERHALYQDLQRKYRRDTAGLCELRDLLASRLERYEDGDASEKERRDALAVAREHLGQVARELHERRVAGAGPVSTAALDRIRPMALAALELELRVTPREDPDGPILIDGRPCRAGPDGAGQVDLLVRTNPGERMGPVAAVASGGERSRIHLGLSLLAAPSADPPLRLFDEMDAGLGMDAAIPVAEVLRDLSAQAQVVVISHLPTVAVRGDAHLAVGKQVHGGRTLMTVRGLAGEARVAEVARLLGGAGWGTDARAQQAYAEELLAAGARGGGGRVWQAADG